MFHFSFSFFHFFLISTQNKTELRRRPDGATHSDPRDASDALFHRLLQDIRHGVEHAGEPAGRAADLLEAVEHGLALLEHGNTGRQPPAIITARGTEQQCQAGASAKPIGHCRAQR